MTRKKHIDALATLTWLGAILVMMMMVSGTARSQQLPAECGSISRPWGPFDYRPERYIPEPTYRSQAALLAIVETAHFTPEVEMLIRGKTSAPPAGDIGYTLGVFPNHHRALLAMVTLGERLKVDRPPISLYTVECWIRRGIAWRPDDNIVRMIYAKYLIKAKRNDEAVAQLKVAIDNAGNNPFTLRNIGFLYFDMKMYDEAMTFAHKAMTMGLNVAGLRGQLISVGKWIDPAPQDFAAAASAASAPESAASR